MRFLLLPRSTGFVAVPIRKNIVDPLHVRSKICMGISEKEHFNTGMKVFQAVCLYLPVLAITLGYLLYSPQAMSQEADQSEASQDDSSLPIQTITTDKQDVDEVEEVTVSGGREKSSAADSGFEVNSIDAEFEMNLSTDINRLIGSTPGVSIRETGGLGSNFKLSINGLSDKQIRYFIDGVPMENFGSALSLNNFPVNLVTDIDIYKGVTPIELSADALGGAINIITPGPEETFLDLSYSAGSFNTHRVALTGQTALKDNVYFRASSFFNHSDNDYEMEKVPRVDALGNQIGTMSAKRFHDQYTSAMVSLKAGVFDTRYADDLSATITIAGNEDELQHPDTSINQVYGGVYTENETKLLSLNYEKSMDNWGLKAYALTGQVEDTFYDTLTRNYDWTGAYTEHSADRQDFGEFSTQSIFERKDDIVAFNLHSSFVLGEQSTVRLAYTANHLERSGNDRINPNNLSFTEPNSVDKQVLAAGLDLSTAEEKLKGTIFVKQYRYDAVINAEEYDDDSSLVNVETKAKKSNGGYGVSANYAVAENLDLKVSYEYAARFPEPNEILGTGQYIAANPGLKPERSHNLNLGIQHELLIAEQPVLWSANLFFREARDFIKFPPSSLVIDNYENLADVSVRGLEASAALFFEPDYSLEINGTWQDMRDQSKVDSDGRTNSHKGDRVPNEPYIFANLRGSKFWDLGISRQVSASWSANYVHSYFLFWESTGNRDTKYTIPSQLTHDIDIEYSFDQGAYNLALSARNIFDQAVYDNRDVQKPGRAFYLKFRYLY